MRRVAFDIGNVLCQIDFDPLKAALRQVGVQPMKFMDWIQHRQDIGALTMKLALKETVTNIKQREIDNILTAWNETIVWNHEMLELLHTIENATKQNVAFLSNMGIEHATFIKRNHPEIFENRILHLSCEVGARKPHKLFFQSFLLEHPEFNGAVFLDDRRENIKMGHDMGFHSFLFNLEEFMKEDVATRRDRLKRMLSLIVDSSVI